MSIKTNIRANEIIISQNTPSLGGGGNLEELLKTFVTKINSLESNISSITETLAGIQKLKIGSIIMYSGTDNNVDDFLLCDGSAVSRSTYADLFSVISTTFGDGDGSTTFNLPNMIGRFPEGASTVGTVKDAGLPNITGGITNTHVRNNVGTAGCGWGAVTCGANRSAYTGEYSESTGTGTWDFNASKSNPIYGKSTTVQPASLTLKYIIKYQ